VNIRVKAPLLILLLACRIAAAAHSQPQTAAHQNAAGADNFQPLADRCHTLMEPNGDVNEAVSACGDVAAAADKFAATTHFIERRAAYVYYAAALLRAHQYDLAESVARRAVSVVKQGHDTAAGTSSAYAVLGNVEGLLGHLEGADVDLTTAESYQREARQTPTDDEPSSVANRKLKVILLFHADVLQKMHRDKAAQSARDEAATL
jgi:hypothetical protein